MWHEKRRPPWGATRAPPCEGILPLSVQPPPQRSCARMPGAARREQEHFFVKQLVNRQACLHLQREREREALAVVERAAPCGENPPDSGIKKESVEWQMASEKSHIEFLSSKNASAAPADVKMPEEQRLSRLWHTHTYIFIHPAKHSLLHIVHKWDQWISNTGDRLTFQDAATRLQCPF